MGKFTRRITEVAGWTTASRILGLIRDILLFASLGAGPLSSAFILAFTLPNLFRRLLGEGALTSSSIPVLAESLERDGEQQTFALLNAILTRLGLAIVIILLVGIPSLGLVEKIPDLMGRWYLGAELSQILMPYMLFICMGALVCGMLNVMGRFGLAAFNQVWLNVTMILGMLAGIAWIPEPGWARVYVLSLSVLAGGVLQFLIPSMGLFREGWKPGVAIKSHPDLGKVLRLFLPGLLGAAIFQINILVSRVLAFSIDDTATGLLYIANRLVELPLGIFAIAITTVIFPELSRLSSLKNEKDYAKTFSEGLNLIFMITLPACVGLILMAQPILGFLFEWGLFGSRDVWAAKPVVIAAAVGLPFFAWSTLLTRAWYARQEMVIPVRLAAVNLLLNLVLGLILMRIWGATGLASANTISGIIHCLALQAFLPGKSIVSGKWKEVLKLSAALVAMAGITVAGMRLMGYFVENNKVADALNVLLVIPLAVAVYTGSLWILRHQQAINFMKRS